MKVVEVNRKKRFNDFDVECEEVKKFKTNIVLINPTNMMDDGKTAENILIPLDTVDNVRIREEEPVR